MPPVYPTRVRTTPAILPKRESGPQNQPRAKVAISVVAGAAASIGGFVVRSEDTVFISIIILSSAGCIYTVETVKTRINKTALIIFRYELCIHISERFFNVYSLSNSCEENMKPPHIAFCFVFQGFATIRYGSNEIKSRPTILKGIQELS